MRSILMLTILVSVLLFVGCKKPSVAEGVQDIEVGQIDSILSFVTGIDLIDVRTAEEFNEASIPGAQNIDVKKDEFTATIQALKKDTPYLVFCRSGKRSTKAVDIMTENGFTHLYHLQGGFLAYEEWKEKQ